MEMGDVWKLKLYERKRRGWRLFFFFLFFFKEYNERGINRGRKSVNFEITRVWSLFLLICNFKIFKVLMNTKCVF